MKPYLLICSLCMTCAAHALPNYRCDIYRVRGTTLERDNQVQDQKNYVATLDACTGFTHVAALKPKPEDFTHQFVLSNNLGQALSLDAQILDNQGSPLKILKKGIARIRRPRGGNEPQVSIFAASQADPNVGFRGECRADETKLCQ